ncbi:MAG: LysM peptidoglycan-binding domain-containing protein [Acidobacteria bacterium]|nr:LysM peptidoglycan-binding domain-containing protein [Acidobacteriota bacterium]
MIEYEVRQGDCLASIAEEHGLAWETIWDLPENAGLKRQRGDPTILQPGDVVRVPELREKTESRPTEARHRFLRKGVPGLLRMRIMRPEESEDSGEAQEPPDEDQEAVDYEDPEAPESGPETPWSDAPYTLVVDGRSQQGSTDRDGRLEARIPPGAREATLIMEPGTAREQRYPLRLGGLDPVASVTGVADRLNNLGFGDGSRPEEMTPELEEAVRGFQQASGLRPTGELDQQTRDKLRELHGS